MSLFPRIGYKPVLTGDFKGSIEAAMSILSLTKREAVKQVISLRLKGTYGVGASILNLSAYKWCNREGWVQKSKTQINPSYYKKSGA